MAARKSPSKETATAPSAKKAPAKRTPAKKAVTPRKTAKPTAKAEAGTASGPASGPTRDQIAHAAYLNYRRRVSLGLPGDQATDWAEAEQQLLTGKQALKKG